MKELLKKLFPYSLVFFETRIANTFTLTDLFLILFIFAAVFQKNDKVVKYKGRKAWIAVLVLFFLVSLAGVFCIGRKYFVTSNFLNAEFRIVLYCIALFLLPQTFVTEKDVRNLVKGLSATLFIFALFGLIDFILLQLNIGFSVSISFSTGNDDPRLHGLVSEPAHFCIFIGLIAAVLLSYYRKQEANMPFGTKFTIFFSFFMVMLSISMTGILFAAILFSYVLLSYIDSVSRKKKQLLLLILPILLVIFVVIIVILNEDRVNRILDMNDVSSNQRMIGTWTMTLYGLEMYNSFLYGLGTGQSGNFIEQSGFLMEGFYNENDINLSNTFSLLLMQNGIIGITLFLLFIYLFYHRRSKLLFVILLAYCFSICDYGALLWSFFVLSEIVMCRHVSSNTIKVVNKKM